MAGPRPDDNYDPTPNVAPSPDMPYDTANVRASAANMGGLIGEGLQNFGKGLEQGTEQVFNTEMYKQGLANEHAASMAELDLSVQGGQLYDKYKSLEGLDAANAKDQYVKDYTDLNNKIRAGLPNDAARRAYDSQAVRRMSFTIQNMNSYAADQRKSAYKQGRTAMLNNQIEQGSDYDTVVNPRQLGATQGDITTSVNDLFTNPDYGAIKSVDVSMDPKTGRLEYKDPLAQAQYDQYLDKSISEFYSRATETISAKSGPVAADKFLEDHKDALSNHSYSQLKNKLATGVRNSESAATVDNIFNQSIEKYNTSTVSDTGPSYATNPGNVKLRDGTFANPTTAVDGATLASNTLRDGYRNMTIEQIAKKWTGEDAQKQADWVKNVTTASGFKGNDIPDLDDPQQVKRLVKGISVAEKSPEDRKAYNDSVLEEGINNSFEGKKANLSQGAPNATRVAQYRNQSDFVMDNYGKILEDTDTESERLHPGDVAFAERNRQKMITKLNGIVKDQQYQNTYNSHQVQDYINKNHITDPSQFDTAPPQIRQAYQDLVAANPNYARSIQHILTAKSFNRRTDYGPAFYQNFTKMANGLVNNSLDFADEINMEEGKNSPLTNHGADVLSQTFKRYTDPQGKLTPDGAAFLKAEQKFLADEKNRRVGSWSSEYDTNENFDKFLHEAIPQIEARVAAKQKEGKSLSQIASELFNKKIDGKDNPEAVRTSVTPPDPMTLLKQRMTGFNTGGKTPPTAMKPEDIKSYDDLKKYAVQTNMSRNDYFKMAREKGFTGPAIPLGQ